MPAPRYDYGTHPSLDQAVPPLVLAIDLGTSSVRALLYDSAGRNAGGAQIRYQWETTPEGGTELAAETLLDVVVRAVDEAVAAAGARASEIAAVGTASLWHSLVGVDAGGRAVTPVYPWSDTRSARVASALRTRLDPAATHARTGTVLHSSYLPARLCWVRDTQPAAFARARLWMSCAEYVQMRLFGEARTSISMASATGLFDQHELRWDPAVLEAIGVPPERLPPLVDIDTTYQGLAEPFASRWPALRDVPWLPAVGDGACANVGSGCTSPDRIALSLGTSGAMRVLVRVDDVRIPPALWCYRLDRRHVLLGGAISNGGNVHRWLRSTLRLPPPEELEAAVASRAPDVHGLTVLPFLAGERSPEWQLGARMTVHGITLDTAPEDIARACLESVAYRLSLVYGPLRAHFPEAGAIVASGGALRRSPAWAQIIADVLGHDLHVATLQETTARGAALLALQHAGVLPGIAESPSMPPGSLVAWDADRHARYADGLARHVALDARLNAERAGLTAPPAG